MHVDAAWGGMWISFLPTFRLIISLHVQVAPWCLKNTRNFSRELKGTLQTQTKSSNTVWLRELPVEIQGRRIKHLFLFSVCVCTFYFPVSLTLKAVFFATFSFLFFIYSLADLIQSHGTRTRCLPVPSSAQHSFVATKVFYRRVTLQTLLTCSKRINSTTQSTTRVTNTSSAVVELTSTSSGLCGGLRERRASKITLTEYSKLPSISLRLWRVVKALNSSPNRSARTFAFGTSRRSSDVCWEMTKTSVSSCTKWRQKLKNVWWRREQWWSLTNRSRQNQTSFDWFSKIRHLRNKTCCISSNSSRNMEKSCFKSNKKVSGSLNKEENINSIANKKRCYCVMWRHERSWKTF